jgi:hypothetical protein
MALETPPCRRRQRGHPAWRVLRGTFPDRAGEVAIPRGSIQEWAAPARQKQPAKFTSDSVKIRQGIESGGTSQVEASQ